MNDDDDTRPEYLRRLFPKRKGKHPANGTPPPMAPAAAKPYAAKALADEVATLAATTEGGRNDQLNESGFNLAQLVAGGYLNRDDVWNALYTTALHIGLTETETVNTLRSAFGAGTSTPRVVAEMDAEPPPPVSGYNPDDARSRDAVDGMNTWPATDEDNEPPSLRERFPAIDWHALWADKTEDEWVLEPLLPARRLVALFSPPKVGKSLLMLEVAVGVSRGVPCLGVTPDRPRRVLYVDFENDPRGDIRSRLQAMGVVPEDLDNLVYLSYPRLAYLDTNVGGFELLAVCQEYDVEVVVIDTISRAVNGEENDNDTWLGFYRNTGLLLKAAGIAAIRLDHTGKDQTKGMRGGSAKYGDVDAVWAMTKITDEQFRLECTANRLPIGEKVLVINRHLHPLHHTVDTTGRNAAREAAVVAALRAIAELDPPVPILGHGSGTPEVWPRLKGHPIVRKTHVEEALRRRKSTGTTALPLEGYTPTHDA